MASFASQWKRVLINLTCLAFERDDRRCVLSPYLTQITRLALRHFRCGYLRLWVLLLTLIRLVRFYIDLFLVIWPCLRTLYILLIGQGRPVSLFHLIRRRPSTVLTEPFWRIFWIVSVLARPFGIGYLHCITMYICISLSMIFLPIQLSFHVASGKVMLCHLCYVLCVAVLACTIRNSSQIEGFLFPGAGHILHFLQNKYINICLE